MEYHRLYLFIYFEEEDAVIHLKISKLGTLAEENWAVPGLLFAYLKDNIIEEYLKQSCLCQIMKHNEGKYT